eukprot:g12923.t1 g12923   contig7:473493-476108(-)
MFLQRDYGSLHKKRCIHYAHKERHPNGTSASVTGPNHSLDEALYRAYEGELVSTVSSASQLLKEFIDMKEAAALVLRECRWMVGVPLGGGMEIITKDDGEWNLGDLEDVAVMGGGVILDERGNAFGEKLDGSVSSRSSAAMEGVGGAGGSNSDIRAVLSKQSSIRRGISVEFGSSNNGSKRWSNDDSHWSEFELMEDFAQQCYAAAIEGIQRLTTDGLAESANISLQDSIVGGDGGGDGAGQGTSNASPSSQQSMGSFFATPADTGIGRCYQPMSRRDCWESNRLICPDYTWADDVITLGQRLLRNLSRHRFITVVGTHGWSRYMSLNVISSLSVHCTNVIMPPTYASCTPHQFPSLEAIHALKYLVTDLLSTTIPSRLNQFRAAAESDAVVSKRLYLVKCEYRAPLRAYIESWMALKSAPMLSMVEKYLNYYHNGHNWEDEKSDNVGGIKGGLIRSNSSSVSSKSMRRKNSTDFIKKTSTAASSTSLLQKRRDELENLLTEKYWKQPAFVEALQLEQYCESLELDMSKMILPLANVAKEIFDRWNGRLRAVAVVSNNGGDDDREVEDEVTEVLGWRDVPYMRELLRRLKSLLCRKPGQDDSTGIRPLLLDLQGLPRLNKDFIDSSIEVPFYRPAPTTSSVFELIASRRDTTTSDEPWFYLEQFLCQVDTLLQLLKQKDTMFLDVGGMAGSKGDKGSLRELTDTLQEVWDGELFRAQYSDWYDMVKRQKELSEGVGELEEDEMSLTELSERIRETEIELGIAMASRDQLEMLRSRLESLSIDMMARHVILAQLVSDVALRELNENIVVLAMNKSASMELPSLSSAQGLFTTQLLASKEVLPVG